MNEPPVAAAANSSHIAPDSSSSGPNPIRRPRPNRARGPRNDNNTNSGAPVAQNTQAPGPRTQSQPTSSNPRLNTPRGNQQPSRDRRQQQPRQQRADQDVASASEAGSSRPRRRRGPGPSNRTGQNAPSALAVAGDDRPGGASTNDSSTTASAPKPSRSRRQFGSQLTSSNTATANNTNTNHNHRARGPKPAPNLDELDLTQRLIYSLTHKEDGLECPICFNSIHPAQPIWSCSPSEETDTCCWKSFHLKCIRPWATKSTKDTRDAYRARNEDREGEWRCPGCQTKRHQVPLTYKCFCGRVQDPTGTRLVTPHSCGEQCSRPRTCEHPCTLPCHPGPCPPCILSVQRSCHCGQEILTKRCSQIQEEDPSFTTSTLSCGRRCSRLLSCGKHVCQQTCHPDECEECEEIENVRCYCGKESRDVPCGEGTMNQCAVMGDEGNVRKWEGRYECEQICGQAYGCGKHFCEKGCHPPSFQPDTCPNDPSLISTCPCGKTPIKPLSRQDCSVPIPTCGSVCSKVHSDSPSDCGHPCLAQCHTGPCPPCTYQITVFCRCGQTSRYVQCSTHRHRTGLSSSSSASHEEEGEGADFLCETRCAGMRHCGRHACKRVCCPLASASLALKKAKEKSKRGRGIPGAEGVLDADTLEAEDIEGWHTCDLTCNKRLGCGIHYCAEPDHRGPCPPCLQSSFEELACNCGRTVIEPPVPCGTLIQCPYQCTRPGPPCGHPKSPHNCHENEECPPCPFLTKKLCSCGKTEVPNVRCSQEKVSCGKPCGKLMDCGYHQCTKLCHSDECGTCTQICAKPRKSCLPLQHGCTAQCHAPSTCPEDEPCTTVVTLHCECGRLQAPASCGASSSNPVSRGHGKFQLKCNQECALAKRNRNLAEALGIDASRAKNASGGGVGGSVGVSKFAVGWPEDLVGYWRANAAFGALVEKTFNEFVFSEKKVQILPHMPPQRREFVHKVAEVYRIQARDVDQEPHRSVELSKRIDTRLPDPLLSKAAGQSSGLGSASSSRSRLAVSSSSRPGAAWGASTPPSTSAPTTAAAVLSRTSTPRPISQSSSLPSVATDRKTYPNSVLTARRTAGASGSASNSTNHLTASSTLSPASPLTPVTPVVVAPTVGEDEAPANWEDESLDE